MRYLAVDLGTKRTGLALGDAITGIAQPRAVLTLPPDETLIEAIARDVEAVGPTAIILGLPLNMDGSEGPAAAAARRFAERLQQRTGLAVELQDERLTSFAAEGKLDRSGRTHKEKKELRDALAAAAILEDYLARKRSDLLDRDEAG